MSCLRQFKNNLGRPCYLSLKHFAHFLFGIISYILLPLLGNSNSEDIFIYTNAMIFNNLFYKLYDHFIILWYLSGTRRCSIKIIVSQIKMTKTRLTAIRNLLYVRNNIAIITPHLAYLLNTNDISKIINHWRILFRKFIYHSPTDAFSTYFQDGTSTHRDPCSRK